MYRNKEDNSIVEHYPNPFSPEKIYDTPVLTAAEVKAVQMVIDEYSRRCEKSKDDIHQGLWREDHKEDEEPRQDDATSKNKHEIVFVTSYTIHDGFGSMQEFDVFNNEEDAWNFVLDKRDNEGITDISVMPRLVDGRLKRKGIRRDEQEN